MSIFLMLISYVSGVKISLINTKTIGHIIDSRFVTHYTYCIPIVQGTIRNVAKYLNSH